MAGNNTYDAGSISVLEGLEAVRKRPGMYIGSVSTKGLNHLIYEIVDNSVDEHLAGFCTEIRVVLEKDGTATVTDNGRGIPVDMHQKGISAARHAVINNAPATFPYKTFRKSMDVTFRYANMNTGITFITFCSIFLEAICT